MLSLNDLPANCTLEEAVTLISRYASIFGLDRSVLPDARALRDWRVRRILTVDGRHFTRRALLEAFVIIRLRQQGMTLSAAGTFARGITDESALYAHLSTTPGTTLGGTDSAVGGAEQRGVDPLLTLQLLATGIIALYTRVRGGALVAHSDRTQLGYETTPAQLYQAMAYLGRYAFIEGREDTAASVHQLLALCQQPLHTWAPQALAHLEGYEEVILVDPDYRVPSDDCETIAANAKRGDLGDLIEDQLHKRLRSTISRSAGADEAYTAIRAFIGGHPMATRGELRALRLNQAIPDEALAFLEGLYQPVHAYEARDGLVRRCRRCGGLISNATNACHLAGCRDDYPETTEQESVPLAEARIPPPEALLYWADPAREELRLYSELQKVRRLRDHVFLYPHSDRCDVALDEEIGIDVKDYRDPARLAQRLNGSIGGLEYYPRRILAIAKRRWNRAYRDQLLDYLTTERRTQLEVMSVTQAIQTLRREALGQPPNPADQAAEDGEPEFPDDDGDFTGAHGYQRVPRP
jgi:hypothetical protein